MCEIDGAGNDAADLSNLRGSYGSRFLPMQVPIDSYHVPFQSIGTSPGSLMIGRLTIGALLILAAIPSPAQPPEDDLYFPPTLDVSVSADPARAAALMWRTNGAWDRPDNVPPENRVRFIREYDWSWNQLLPMIFFDQASSTIPPRYIRLTGAAQARDYSEASAPEIPATLLHCRVFPKYYDLLNIIGSRMAAFPEYRIELEGGFSAETGENPELAYERSLVVREYLEHVWNIDTGRMTLLPPRQMCSGNRHIFDQEEARRVIIHTHSLSLIRPVRFKEYKPVSEAVFFNITIDPRLPTDEIRSIEFVVASGSRSLGRVSLPLSPDSSVYRYLGVGRVPWDLGDREEQISAQAFVTARNGRTYASRMIMIPIDIAERKDTSSPRAGTPLSPPMPIRFFEAGDSCLSSLQELLLVETVRTMQERILSHPDQIPLLTVDATTIAAELSDDNVADLAAAREQYRSTLLVFREITADPYLEPTLYLVPPPKESIPFGSRGQGLYTELMNAWYGDHSESAARGEKLQSVYSYPGNSASVNGALKTAREDVVVSRLRMELGEHMPGADIGRSERSPNATFTPESRLYYRIVNIGVGFLPGG